MLNLRRNLNLRRLTSSPRSVLILALGLLLAACFGLVYDESKSIQGKVVRVIDGDTIELLDSSNKSYKIRFFGIDAPEKKQAFGEKSREFLASLIAGKHVVVSLKDRDKYGRFLGVVRLNDEDINQKMVASGYAWAYSYYTEIYLKDQREAKARKRGLWQDKNAIEPYKWRKKQKDKE